MGSRAISTIIAAALFSCMSTGCASRRVTIPYFESHDNPPIRQAKPMLAASINGVSGHFLIDTGAACSILTMTAARSCALGVLPSEDRASSIGSEVALLQTTNVTIKLAADVDIHWRNILVLPDEADKQIQTDTNVFGILGYPTLAARHTVIDMKRKTLTMTPNPHGGANRR
jgi:hypothetical protein